jgi:hypothetical protein
MRVDERPQLAELPQALAPLHARGEAVASPRPHERLGRVAREPGGPQPREQIPKRREGPLRELARLPRRVEWAPFPQVGLSQVVADTRHLAQPYADAGAPLCERLEPARVGQRVGQHDAARGR